MLLEHKDRQVNIKSSISQMEFLPRNEKTSIFYYPFLSAFYFLLKHSSGTHPFVMSLIPHDASPRLVIAPGVSFVLLSRLRAALFCLEFFLDN